MPVTPVLACNKPTFIASSFHALPPARMQEQRFGTLTCINACRRNDHGNLKLAQCLGIGRLSNTCCIFDRLVKLPIF
ncbi:hypothetical protein [Devosia sp.]|jgi:hypothetical protein|uniref:hypothetical protein n=1 Tax=Devosia sp. TaxID=1871048 RepID=UPI0037C11775